MLPRNTIETKFLKENFSYNRSGFLVWKIGKKKGMRVGWIENGRHKVRLNGKKFLIQRLIFQWHKGYCGDVIDHKDRNSLNDKIGNLRDVSQGINARNKGPQSNNKSGFKGVCFCNTNKHWIATFMIDGKRFSFTKIKTKKEAVEIYKRKRREVEIAFNVRY